jgi:hypothetical protein
MQKRFAGWAAVLAVLSLIIGGMVLEGGALTIGRAYAQVEDTTMGEDNTTVYLPLVVRNGVIRAEEAIMILTPGPGSRVTSPVRVSGEADPTFEQNLVVRVLLADGSLVSQVATTIQAEVGQRGAFSVDVPVNLTAEQAIFIQVFAASPRDGRITHLSSAGVTFTPTGPAVIETRPEYPEQIVIFEPQLGAQVSGGSVHVRGFGLATFEQTLNVDVQDQNGNVIGSEAVIVAAPALGKPGYFEADVTFTVGRAQPGRVVVRDVSPAFGGTVHLSSVEVNLAP